MKNAIFLILLLLFLGCSNKVIINSNQNDLVITNLNHKYELNSIIDITDSRTIKINKKGYKEKIITVKKIFPQKIYDIELEKAINKVKFSNIFTEIKVMANGKEIHSPYSLETGDYEFIIKQKGFVEEKVSIYLFENTKVQLKSSKKIVINNIPDNIQKIMHNNKIISEDSSIIVNNNDPLKIHLNNNRKLILDINYKDLNDNILDIDNLLKKFDKKYKLDFSLDSNWLYQLDPQIVKSLNSPESAMYQTNHESISKQNQIIRDPLYSYWPISIANPDKSIIGATVKISYEGYTKEVLISNKFYNENIKKSEYMMDVLSTRHLQVSILNKYAPFDTGFVTVRLEKDSKILDSAELQMGKDITSFYPKNHFSIYDTPVDSIFKKYTNKSKNKKFLYLSKDIKEPYVIIFMGQNKYSSNSIYFQDYIPVYLGKVNEFNNIPSEITFNENTQNEYFIYVTDNLDDIKNFSVYYFQRLN